MNNLQPDFYGQFSYNIEIGHNLLTSKLGNSIIQICKENLAKMLGGFIMNKEEILEKSRQENRGGDERERQVKDKSMMWSYIVMILMVAIFSFIRSEQGLPFMDLSATLGASVCAAMAYRFIKTKDKQYLIIAIIALIVAVTATVRFFMGH
jgi:hypothetical protein